MGAVLMVFNEQLCLLGGVDSQPYYLSDVWVSTDGVQWVAQTPMPGAAAGAAAVVLGSSILTTGGILGRDDSLSNFVAVEYQAVGIRGTLPSAFSCNAVI